jgi:hypothetical protein
MSAQNRAAQKKNEQIVKDNIPPTPPPHFRLPNRKLSTERIRIAMQSHIPSNINQLPNIAKKSLGEMGTLLRIVQQKEGVQDHCVDIIQIVRKVRFVME